MDESPAVLFDSYEQDFRHLIQSVEQKLGVDAKDQRGEQRKAALRKVEIELDEADDIVSQLEIEIQGIPKSIKGQYVSRLKQVKADLVKYKKLSKDIHSQAARADLMGGFRRGAGSSPSDDPYGENGERSRLLAGTETLADGSRRLQDSTGIALEAEEQGADILRNLRRQREQIENTRDTLQQADTHIDRSSTTIKGMIRHMYKQRVIISLIIAFFVIMIGVILYFKLVRR
ncbi:vesicle transport v-snare protein vti1 [Cyathus striatus]|nr:vesicle transport v-snare protein vti1 [Cyathus striatus]